MHTRYLSRELRARVQAAGTLFGSLGPGTSCAGIDYTELVDGAAAGERPDKGVLATSRTDDEHSHRGIV